MKREPEGDSCGWKAMPSMTVELAKLAISILVYPPYEVEKIRRMVDRDWEMLPNKEKWSMRFE